MLLELSLEVIRDRPPVCEFTQDREAMKNLRAFDKVRIAHFAIIDVNY